MHTTTTDQMFLDAIGELQSTRHTYGGGLSNHGPMAVEALVSLGKPEVIPAFLADYVPRLRSGAPADPVVGPVRGWLADRLPDLVASAGKHAGHGLLRTAHAVRAIERVAAHSGVVPEVLLTELSAAVGYWQAGDELLPAPSALTGSTPLPAWYDELPRLPLEERVDGLLTVTLGKAARMSGFVEQVARLDSAGQVPDILDQLALAAAGRYLANDGLANFTLLHGVTVSSMARVLVPHLRPRDQAQLAASVAGFVAAAVVGFDDGPAVDGRTWTVGEDLATAAAASLDDHTIKFADACLGLAQRTGSTVPIRAVQRRIIETAHR